MLEEGAKPEKIMESSEADAEKDFWIDQFSVWNSKLYFSFRSNDGSKSTLIEYDPGSQKERVVLKGEEIGICAMAKGPLYFAGEEPGIQVLNLETGEIQSLLKSPESLGKGGLGSFCRLSRDGQYLYAHDMNTPDEADETGNRRETAEIFVFDLKGNLVEILEAPNTGESFNAYWGDPDILVIYNSYGYLYYDKQTKEWKEWGEWDK